MISTFQALVVALIALLPGASYTFAVERTVGGYGVKLADRMLRFVAASAIFHAVASGPEYLLYRRYVATGALGQGHVPAWLIEVMALAYVVGPIAVGTALAHLRRPEPPAPVLPATAVPAGSGTAAPAAAKQSWIKRGWRAVFVGGRAVRGITGRRMRATGRWAIGEQVEPRAWDWTWQPGIKAVVRIKFKSGAWVAGFWGRFHSTATGRAFRRSYASGYPEDGELYLCVGFQIDPTSGELVRDSTGKPVPVEGERGLLLRWSEVEYLDIQEF